jgi:hypothetical protein
MRAFDSATKGREYVASYLSSVSAADGKETPHRNGHLLLRQIRLEGLAGAREYFTTAFKQEATRHLKMAHCEVTGPSVARTPLIISEKLGKMLFLGMRG